MYPEKSFLTTCRLLSIVIAIELTSVMRCARICDETGIPPILLFQKEKEYLQSLPSEKVLESYLSHDRQTTVRTDSMVTYLKNKYSVPTDYVGKPVRLKVSNESLHFLYA